MSDLKLVSFQMTLPNRRDGGLIIMCAAIYLLRHVLIVPYQNNSSVVLGFRFLV